MLPGVSKTALLTLRARADEHARPDRIFEDPLAADWFARIEWPAELDPWYADDPQQHLAFRAGDIDQLVLRYAAASSAPLQVVELGCGLSTRRQRLHPLEVARWVDLDLPEVVALREGWAPWDDRHVHLGRSVLDRSWFDAVAPGPTLFIAEGLLYYLPKSDVEGLLRDMRERFSGAALILDVLGTRDHSRLLERTAEVGCPIQWKFEGGIDQVLPEFGLTAPAGMEPDTVFVEAVRRYWDRLDAGTRVALYWAQNQPGALADRTQNVIGVLTPLSR